MVLNEIPQAPEPSFLSSFSKLQASSFWYIWFLINLNIPFHSSTYTKICSVLLAFLLLLFMTFRVPTVPTEWNQMRRYSDNGRQRGREEMPDGRVITSPRGKFVSRYALAFHISMLWSLFRPHYLWKALCKIRKKYIGLIHECIFVLKWFQSRALKERSWSQVFVAVHLRQKYPLPILFLCRKRT